MNIQYENLKPNSLAKYKNKTYKIDHIVVNTKSIMVHLEGVSNPVNLEQLEVEKITLDTTPIVQQYRNKNRN